MTSSVPTGAVFLSTLSLAPSGRATAGSVAATCLRVPPCKRRCTTILSAHVRNGFWITAFGGGDVLGTWRTPLSV
jgi:hypothetical protein